MTRKISVVTISLIYMFIGLLNVYYSLIPVLSSSGTFVIRLFPLVVGALAFHAGLTMFRLNEFGRKLVIFWLFIRVIINILSILLFLKDGTGFRVENYFGETIYRIENPYALPGFLLAWMLIALLTIIFLSQKETKAIFAPEATKNVEPDITFA